MKISVSDAIKQLLNIIAQLEETYEGKNKKFTLDGTTGWRFRRSFSRNKIRS